MKLDALIKIITKTKKRVGRGAGSGKGQHTSGRGQKGQKSRNKVPQWFEGGQLPLIRRTPFIRGKDRFASLTDKPYVITTEQLNVFADNAVVDIDTIRKESKLKISKNLTPSFKVVVRGKLERALTVKVPASKGAITAIESAGGSYQN